MECNHPEHLEELKDHKAHGRIRMIPGEVADKDGWVNVEVFTVHVCPGCLKSTEKVEICRMRKAQKTEV